MSFLRNFIRFSRLHTVIGTTLSIVALYCMALAVSNDHVQDYSLLLLTILGCLGANIYIVGLNQITDVAIDRINKPYLPLASGAFSMRMGYVIILVSLVVAVYLGKYMLLTVLLSLALGTAYSLPPFRLKRFVFWAAFCIIAVRGLIVNLLLFLHFHYNMNGKENITDMVWLLTATIFVYSIVIAWFKDIPDMDGDRQFNIKTLTLQLGAKQVFLIGNGLVSLVYLGLAIVPFLVELPIKNQLFSIAHLVFLAALWIAAAKTKLDVQASVRQFYLFIWVLFFLEYATFAVVGFK